MCVNDATVALVDTVAMRTRRSDLNDEPEYPETLSLGSWSWRWTGSVLATESSTVGGSEARLRFPVGTTDPALSDEILEATATELGRH